MLYSNTVFLIFGALVFFIFGSVVGSFLNVVILRFGTKKGLTGRSACPNCGQKLSAPDLVPILSYVFLGGKCRYCQHPISVQYPLVEFSTALLFATAYWLVASRFYGLSSTPGFGDFFSFGYLLFFISVLLVLSVFDIRKGIIPDKILLPSILVAAVYLAISSLTKSSDSFEVMRLVTIDLVATFGLAAFFLFLIIITKGRGMGGGDLKLSIFIGLSLGWPLALVGVILGFLTGALAAVMLILLGKKGFGQTIAFGPFLALGAYLSALCGDKLLGLYLKTLGL